MLRIVGIQRSPWSEREFVLLQNQGAMRVRLRGHALIAETAFDDPDSSATHFFTEEELIPAGMHVLLISGVGNSRWGKTKDGQTIFNVYMNRPSAVWEFAPGPLHILNVHHSYISRAVPTHSPGEQVGTTEML